MKKGKNTDERIIALQNKIYKEAYNLTVGLLAACMVIKVILYRPPVLWAEMVCLLVPLVYQLIRNIQYGSDALDMQKSWKKIMATYGLMGIGGALIIIGLLYFRSTLPLPTILLRGAIGFFGIMLLGTFVYLILGWISKMGAKKKEEKIISQCNDE